MVASNLEKSLENLRQADKGFDATSVNVVAMPLFHIGGSG